MSPVTRATTACRAGSPEPAGQDARAAGDADGAGLGRGGLALAYAGVFLTALAYLAFQIAASRLLSLLLSYHFVFALVSLAMLGLGLGGVIARYAFAKILSPRDSLGILAGANAAAGLAILAGLVVVLRIAERPWIGDPAGMLIVLGILSVPLICAGVAFAQLFRSFGAISGRVYGADLAGAGLGCLGVIWALDQVGGVGSLLLAAALAAAGAVAFAWPGRASNGGAAGATMIVFAVLGLVLAAFLVGQYDPHVPVGSNPQKEIHDAMAGPGAGELEASRWSSFGRTDLVSFGDRRGYKDLYIDGTAGSPMYRFTGDFTQPGTAVEALVNAFPGYFPFLFRPGADGERALVIGPGGGRDILLARMAGYGHVRAVEVNPDLVELVRRQSVYNGDLFGPRDDIEVIVDEGRSFVRRDDGRYELVMLSLPVTHTSRSRDGFALTESFLLTAEALLEYVDALSPTGELVIIAHDEAAVLRLLTTAISAMAGRGHSARDVMARSYVLGSFPYPVFVLRQDPGTAERSRAMMAEARQRGYSLVSSYFPKIAIPGAVSPVLQALEQGRMSVEDLVRQAAERGVDISVVRDDSPFFHHFEVGPPAAVTAVAAIAAVLALVVLVGSAAGAWRGRTRSHGRFLYPGLFFLLGLGFMLIEVSFIQRFMLYLGQPVHVLAVVLFALLFGMSIGSIASNRVAVTRIAPVLAAAGLAGAVSLALVAALLPPVFDATLALPLPARIAIAAAALVPLGIVLGVPFPLGIRALVFAGEADRIPWMWAINGIASVLGAAAAVLGAMQYGLSQVLLASVLCYAGVAVIGLVGWRTAPTDPGVAQRK
jgi:SAM-dependent methyltransferase